jgi:hypothetical protein
MPCDPENLSSELETELMVFCQDHDLVQLYKEYNWFKDVWQLTDGFPDIVALELATTKAAKNNALARLHVVNICRWGRLKFPDDVVWPSNFTLPLYENESPSKMTRNPAGFIELMLEKKKQGLLRGLGPTYMTKILRFAAPAELGAIDTRIVQTYGQSGNHPWISLITCEGESGRPYVPEDSHRQPSWPSEYTKWVNILRFLAHSMNRSSKWCPHPEKFVINGLREQGAWTCADVEMALFSYASQDIASR